MSVRTVSPPADPLGETLYLLQLRGTLYCSAELSAPWGLEVPELKDTMTFQVVTAGRCWLEVAGAKPILLEQGCLTLLPHGTAHQFRSSPKAKLEPLFEVPVRRISDRYEIMRHGGGGEVTQAMYGVVQFDHVAAQRLLKVLPTVVQINTWDEESGSWLLSTLRLIAREATSLRPGGETVITRLADVLVIQAIRAWLDTTAQAKRGWLAALRDAQVGRALAAIHASPSGAWTLSSLAKQAGMSRSAFSARFSELVGEPAMRYLARWRMDLAHAHLQQSSEPVATLAERFGYQSEAAFCRAFKRAFGLAPGAAREAARSRGPEA